MINIHICDDKEIELKQIKKALSYAKSVIDSEIEFHNVTTKPSEILAYIPTPTVKDVYFLDIDLELPNLNGLSLAVQIRERNPSAFICFVTTHAEMSYLTFKYKVMAFDFILKDSYENMLNSFVECLRALVKQVESLEESREEVIELDSYHEKKRIKVDSIIAFETVGNHKIRMYGDTQVLNLSRSLASLKKELPDNFLDFHRSYLINSDKIASYDKVAGRITMSNGLDVYVPTRKKKSVFSMLEK
ncbi:LytR/AlgR family response regulator transcription factor [Candidatus Enterococcus mansonii]|uniref:Stage 0 sporulation protein A homolog n=1 Tax=Candidatus Enterococcus mansonii TaxID=1834181 RepID=A0A242CEB6_9ENTE|nr:LytTR family DNA-binding domain-containing protein [Enterococcus sp. 4G2_DIV0659]OTO08583.1 hypothetical protein A5880_001583 [Enterococcus sp. 4G2_DIV0659]